MPYTSAISACLTRCCDNGYDTVRIVESDGTVVLPIEPTGLAFELYVERPDCSSSFCIGCGVRCPSASRGASMEYGDHLFWNRRRRAQSGVAAMVLADCMIR